MSATGYDVAIAIIFGVPALLLFGIVKEKDNERVIERLRNLAALAGVILLLVGAALIAKNAGIAIWS